MSNKTSVTSGEETVYPLMLNLNGPANLSLHWRLLSSVELQTMYMYDNSLSHATLMASTLDQFKSKAITTKQQTSVCK
jgi:hypothetical protein